MGDGLGVHHCAQRGLAFARITHGHGCDLGLEFRGKGVGDGIHHDDPFGRHANLTLVHERAERSGFYGFIQIGVLKNEQRCLATQFKQDGLEVLRAACGDDAANGCGAGEIDAADGGMVDHRADHIGSILRRIGDEVDDAAAKPGLHKCLNDQAMGARALLRRLENDSVAAGERHGDGAGGQDDRRVPRGHGQDDASSFPHGHGDAAGLVGGNDFPANLGGEGCGFAHHGAGQHQVEARPAFGRADFAHHGVDEIGGFCVERIGGFHKGAAARGRAKRRPCGESGLCRIDGGNGVIDTGCGGNGGDVAGHRVDTFECGGGAALLAAHDQKHFICRHIPTPLLLL